MQRRRAVLIEPSADCGPSTIRKLPRTELVSHFAANAVTPICSCAGLAFRVELDCQLDGCNNKDWAQAFAYDIAAVTVSSDLNAAVKLI